MKKTISIILVLATLLGTLAMLPLGTWAASVGGNGDILEENKPYKNTELYDNYKEQDYYSAAHKLAADENMKLMVNYAGKSLYANKYTGEVYVLDNVTGNIMHSNPYYLKDLADTYAINTLSQLTIKYSGVNKNIIGGDFETYRDSAQYGQISIESIRDGVRVNYTLGNAAKRYILPYGILATEFIEQILAHMQEQVVKDLEQAILVDAKMPTDQYKWIDYEEFCKDNVSQYSTLKALGKEYVYGNIAAFEDWYEYIITDVYTKYHSSFKPSTTRPSYVTAPAKVKLLAQDYITLTAMYGYISPYDEIYNPGNVKGDDPSKWTTGANFEQYAVLQEKVNHPVYGVPYYGNAIFVMDAGETTSAKMYMNIERIISENAGVEGYSLAKATAAEDRVGITPPNKNTAIFHAAIEYKLTSDGFTAEMPATSLIYDQSKYKITSISLLPYMGTANVREDGYFFFPDGSGTLVDFDLSRTQGVTMSGQIYGQDHAQYMIGGRYTKSISMPVFGMVYDKNTYMVKTPFGVDCPISFDEYTKKANKITYRYDAGAEGDASDDKYYAVLPHGEEVETLYYYTWETDLSTGLLLPVKNPLTPDIYATVTTTLRESDYYIAENREAGFLAIVEEGASLSQIYANFNMKDGKAEKMVKLGITFSHRQTDTYKFNGEDITVEANKKYNGSYKVRYVMLTDAQDASEAGLTASEYYEPSYAGMADAYRDYLVKNELLPASGDIKDQLPLIIESFGVVQTKKKFMSIPFTVDVALTTFNNVKSMYAELAARDIENIKFRLTGFANGGMNSKYPVKLKWEDEAGGKKGFQSLLSFASRPDRKDAGLEIYPNFDFLYVKNTGWFDGIDIKDIGARGGDNRYSIRKEYSSFYQGYSRDPANGIVVASNKLNNLFGKFRKKYTKFGNDAISLTDMAADLSGDFNKDNVLTREDSVKNITKLLKTAEKAYSNVMSDGGNMYALKYMDYLLNVPLDSSHYKRGTRTVPFWGMVVHGHVQYAGNPFNENANKEEALLRAIESGANLYFTLSYDNTDLLKDSGTLNKYYAVDYQISKDTVEKYYKKLNAVIGDLQSYHIVGHDRLNVERVGIAAEEALFLEELEDEFLLRLEEQVEGAKEELRGFILALKALNVNTNRLRALYDTNMDGLLLGEEELNAAWNDLFIKKEDIQEIVKTYYRNSFVSELFDGKNFAMEDSVNRTTEIEYAARDLLGMIVNGDLDIAFGQTVGVIFDDAAVLESARKMLSVKELSEEFVAEIRAYMEQVGSNGNDTTLKVSIGDVVYTPENSYFTTSEYLDGDNYKPTQSTISNGTVIMVTYSNGTDTVRILLNFNIFAVNVNVGGDVGTVTLEKYGYFRLD